MKMRGLGTIFQRGNIWWIQYAHRGKIHRESSRSDKRADATRLLKRRLGEIGQGRFVGPAGDRVSFENLMEMLVEDYKVNDRKSMQRTRTSRLHLEEHFAGMKA
jgi:hypothetical protein